MNRTKSTNVYESRSLAISGNQLRAFRESIGLTQVELGRRSGYSERLIRKAETTGLLSTDAVNDIVFALQESGSSVCVEELLLDPSTIGMRFAQAYISRETALMENVERHLHRDFAFFYSGTRPPGLAGEWNRHNFGQWWHRHLQWEQNVTAVCTQVRFLVSHDAMLVRYIERICTTTTSFEPIWNNLHFAFHKSHIVRIEHEFDTAATDALWNNYLCSE